MSKKSNIGKLPIKLPVGVTLEIVGKEVKVTGSKGSLALKVPKGLVIKTDDRNVHVDITEDTARLKALHGTIRSLIANMVVGVSEGWTKVLEMVGTGYRAEVSGKDLTLTVGFSHPVVIEAPEGINFEVQKNVITVLGIDKEIVGLIADKIRSVRPPEPYKGKGIKYQDEVIRRKAGKAAKAQGAA